MTIEEFNSEIFMEPRKKPYVFEKSKKMANKAWDVNFNEFKTYDIDPLYDEHRKTTTFWLKWAEIFFRIGEHSKKDLKLLRQIVDDECELQGIPRDD